MDAAESLCWCLLRFHLPATHGDGNDRLPSIGMTVPHDDGCQVPTASGLAHAAVDEHAGTSMQGQAADKQSAAMHPNLVRRAFAV